MRSTLAGLTVSLVLAVAPSVSEAADLAVGSARLQPIDRSGIRARVAFLDAGPSVGLIVTAIATGLDPTQTYFSLVYDVGSLPSGPDACEPTGPLLTAAQMGVGFWQVAPSGVGRLFAVKQGDGYAALEDIGAMSIRVVQGAPPAGFVLQACGRVRSKDFQLKP
jgi:hypothetical protein